jgi:hypothetical protein
MDSIQYRFKFKDSIKDITIVRKVSEKPKKDSLKEKVPQVKQVLTNSKKRLQKH